MKIIDLGCWYFGLLEDKIFRNFLLPHICKLPVKMRSWSLSKYGEFHSDNVEAQDTKFLEVKNWLNWFVTVINSGRSWLCFFIMSHTRFRVSAHFVIAWMSTNSLLEAGALSES